MFGLTRNGVLVGLVLFCSFFEGGRWGVLGFGGFG